ncbi:MAG: hypothetical protein AAF202_00375 [Pseudomonadota bacterium]
MNCPLEMAKRGAESLAFWERVSGSKIYRLMKGFEEPPHVESFRTYHYHMFRELDMVDMILELPYKSVTSHLQFMKHRAPWYEEIDEHTVLATVEDGYLGAKALYTTRVDSLDVDIMRHSLPLDQTPREVLEFRVKIAGRRTVVAQRIFGSASSVGLRRGQIATTVMALAAQARQVSEDYNIEVVHTHPYDAIDLGETSIANTDFSNGDIDTAIRTYRLIEGVVPRDKFQFSIVTGTRVGLITKGVLIERTLP